MAYSWAKVYIEVIDDHKMGTLPDSLWRRVIELILLAKKNDKDGWLPGMIEMSWALRMSAEQLEADLEKLHQVGIVEPKEGNWYLTNFVKRQAFEPVVERVRNFRKRNEKQSCNDSVTESYQTILDTDTDTDEDKEIGAPAPAKSKPDKSKLRFDITPEGASMAQKLRAVYESKGYRPPEFYANAAQRDAYLTAFMALGSTVENVLDSAMQRDIVDRGKLLGWLQGCVKRNGNGRKPQSGSDGLSVLDKAIAISARHDAERESRNGK